MVCKNKATLALKQKFLAGTLSSMSFDIPLVKVVLGCFLIINLR